MQQGKVRISEWRAGLAGNEGCVGLGRHACARLVAAACIVTMAGCAQTPPAGPSRPPVNLSGYSPAFKEGFAAGCDTAKGNVRRDERRFGEDAQYARGWEDGRSICGRR